MHLENDKKIFRRILTLTFVGITLFVPIKNNKEKGNMEHLKIEVDDKDWFEKHLQFSYKKEDITSLYLSGKCR